ncbi:MAG: hypothetical protein IJI66_00110 [Erysipelotrichaceae bacterium]|nr:hypothetical protein [Erysipelotrichaceae bacterium]
MGFITNYSGIVALFVYGILLVLLLSFTKKKEVKTETEEVKPVNTATVRTPLDLEDEDATVACLVAAIECREECHRNVAIRNVRRIA